MNPLEEIGKLVGKPVEVLTSVLNRPSQAARNGPALPLTVVDMLRGRSLEDSVKDRVVMITGASSGIGEVTAKKIGAAGGEVVLVARGKEKLEAVAEEVRASGGVAHVAPCDLSDQDAIEIMARGVLADVGRVDILVNNAGRSIRRSLALSYDRMHDFERTMQLNYFAAVRLILLLVPKMRENHFGQIINVSSVGVQTRVPRFGAYIASKAALDTLSDAFQAETHADNVRFTTVHMVLVRTPMIAPTTIYQRFPTLTPDQAGDVLCNAIVHRPRRVSPPFGQIASFADAISPQIMDRVRNAGFQMFPDSTASRGSKDTTPDQPVSAQGRAFAELTRGVHW